MAKIKAILLLVELIGKKKSLYINTLNMRDLAFDKEDLVTIDEVVEMLEKNKDTKILDIRYIISESKYITFSWSKSRI